MHIKNLGKIQTKIFTHVGILITIKRIKIILYIIDEI